MVLLHFLGALGMVCAVIAILLLGLATWRTRRGVAFLSLLIATIAPPGTVITKIAADGHDYGLAERVTIYPVYVWVALMGLVFLLARRPRPAMASVPRLPWLPH